MNLHANGRVLYVSMVDVSVSNGPGVNEREFMASLFGKFGRRVHVLVPTPRTDCADIRRSQTTFYRNSPKWSPLGFLLQQLELKKKIQRLLAQQSFDLIATRLGVLPLGFCLADKRNVPYAVKTLGAVQEFTRNRGLKGLICKSIGWFNLYVYRKIIARALAVDACTELLLKSHESEFGLPSDRLLLQGNATNVGRFFPQDTSKARAALHIEHLDPVLGFAGGYPADRGGMEMLDVAKRLLGEYPNLGVVILGGQGAERLRSRASELGIADQTMIPGQVPYDEVPLYMNAFDICFGLDRPERFQRWGNSYQKVRQYLACGKPVISCLPAGSTLLRENLVESVDADDLDAIEAITRGFLGRSERARRLHAERAVAYARKHLSSEAALNRRIDFWNELISPDMPLAKSA